MNGTCIELSGGRRDWPVYACLCGVCYVQDSWTPFHLALSRKDLAVVQTVLDHKPDVDMQDHVRNSVFYVHVHAVSAHIIHVRNS